MSPEDALSTSRRALAGHMRTILVTFTQVNIANTTFILPFLNVRHYCQSQAMPRRCVAAQLCDTNSGVGYVSSETGDKRQRSTEFGRPFM